jgi:hypothetical protein
MRSVECRRDTSTDADTPTWGDREHETDRIATYMGVHRPLFGLMSPRAVALSTDSHTTTSIGRTVGEVCENSIATREVDPVDRASGIDQADCTDRIDRDDRRSRPRSGCP